MASAPERAHLNRITFDKWSIKEQLCLASVVCRNGENNWLAISRALRHIIGNEAATRPSDWFSPKSCALQHSHLIENIKGEKQNMRTTESSSETSSPESFESICATVMNRLKEDRIQEIKFDIRKSQEEYAKLHTEIKILKTDQMDDDQVLEMWKEIEKQQETQRIEEMKLENQMRERENLQQEMQRNWRTTDILPTNTSDSISPVNIESLINTVNRDESSPSNQQQSQSGPSPLLSSLLKSPTTNVNTNVTSSSIVISSSSIRTTAPTITTLLTSGTIPKSNQPAITLKSSIPPNEAVQILTRPISGPPTDVLSSSIPIPNPSPSKIAPTLSMLLEKNKSNLTVANQESGTLNKSKTIQSTTLPPHEGKSAADSNNEEVPMDIEEDIVSHDDSTKTNANVGESDETDPNEEEQLLEVFENILNIDLDIDVNAVMDEAEADFLKGVDEEPVRETNDVKNVKIVEKKKDESSKSLENKPLSIIKEEKHQEFKEIKEQPKVEENLDIENVEKEKEKEKKPVTKIETISSDDSNDNLPLSEVASLENKTDRVNPDKKEDEGFLESNHDTKEIKTEGTSTVEAETSSIETEEKCKRIPPTLNDSNAEDMLTSDERSDISEVIIIPTDDDESNSDKNVTETETPIVSLEADSIKVEEENEEKDVKEKINTDTPTTHINVLPKKEPTSVERQEDNSSVNQTSVSSVSLPTISIADTDEDSSTTDVSIITRKDEKIISTGKIIPQQQPRKSFQDVTHGEQKTDDESPLPSSSITPARPLAFRKLRNRSESPMIHDETTTTSDHSTNQRLRRRYSSTPVIDSVPNSPASIERDETRVPKKALLNIYNSFLHNKNASVIQRTLTEDYTSKTTEVCLRSIDFPTIKKHIENGIIRNVNELQRDFLLMGYNAMMITPINSNSFNRITNFITDCKGIREIHINKGNTESASKAEKDNRSLHNTSIKGRSGSRKSQRIS